MLAVLIPVLIHGSDHVVEVRFEIIKCHPEEPVVLYCVAKGFLCLLSPGRGILITPGAFPLLAAPWVSYLHQLLTVVLL